MTFDLDLDIDDIVREMDTEDCQEMISACVDKIKRRGKHVTNSIYSNSDMLERLDEIDNQRDMMKLAFIMEVFDKYSEEDLRNLLTR
jgi:hypothetical protein